MEVIAGLSYGTKKCWTIAYSLAVALLIIEQCGLVSSDPVDQNKTLVSEAQKQRAASLIEEIIRQGGNPVECLEKELDRVKQGKHLKAYEDAMDHMFEPDHGLFDDFSKEKYEYLQPGEFDDDEDDDDVFDHDHYDHHQPDDSHNDEGLQRSSTEAVSPNMAASEATSSVQKSPETQASQPPDQIDHHDEEDHDDYYHDDERVYQTQTAPEAPPIILKSMAIDPKSGDQIHQTVMESLPKFAGEPKVVSVTESVTSPDGKIHRSSLSRSSSLSSVASSTAFGPRGAYADHQAPEEHSFFSPANAEVHDGYEGDEEDTASSKPQNHDGINHHLDVNHVDLHDNAKPEYHDGDSHEDHHQPHGEHYEETYIDNSNPNDPKKVHVKQSVKSSVGPHGESHEHHESRVSTSLGNNPNSFHHSSSSFSSSSSSSSTTNNNKHARKPRRQSSKKSSRQYVANTMRPPRIPALPLMPVTHAWVQYGMPGFPYLVNGHASPFGYQFPFAVNGGFLKGMPHTKMNKKKIKKMRRAQKRAAELRASFAQASAMASVH